MHSIAENSPKIQNKQVFNGHSAILIFRHLFGSVLHCERTLLGAQSTGIYKYSDKHILTGSLCFKGSHKIPPDNEPSSCSRFTMKCFGVEETIWFFLSHKTTLKKARRPCWRIPGKRSRNPLVPTTSQCSRVGCKGKKPCRDFSHETRVIKKREISQTHLTCPQGV